MKLQVFSAALMAVVFPAFAASYLSNTHRTQVLFTKSAWLLGVVMFLIALLTVLFGQQVLSLWLDEAFAQQSKWVLYWAAIGLFVNALSFVPFALLQAIGRADITAKINLIELPFYFVVLFFALAQWGIVGAAIASTLRLTINAFLLFFYSGHFYVQVRKQSRIVSLLMLIGLSVLLLLLRYH
ncbi:MAG: polysaccharide biosynthesis C-terminal domain-containing protein [Gammaproteobacteria bacterium]|nr:polysaccharide biosynthesis C-terminal domain-containing protein [Gammaproteobacteria bacterium]